MPISKIPEHFVPSLASSAANHAFPGISDADSRKA